MQFVPPLNRNVPKADREKPAGAHLPYARHVDGKTIETRDGLLMQTIQIGGLLFETADTNELNYRSELRDAMLRGIGSSRYAIYHHVVRRRADVSLESRFADAFSKSLDERWRARVEAKQLYVNDLFLTIVRRPVQGRLGMLDRLKFLFGRHDFDRHAAFAADKRSLDAATDAMTASVSS